MKKFRWLLILFCSSCSSTFSSNEQESISSYIEPNWSFLVQTQATYLNTEDFYPSLPTEYNQEFLQIARFFSPIKGYINLVTTAPPLDRKQLFMSSINKIRSCSDNLNISDILSENFQAVKFKSQEYDNLRGRAQYYQETLCYGAQISLVFFNNPEEKSQIVRFYRSSNAKNFSVVFQKDIDKLQDDEVYELVTKKYRKKINGEVLPYLEEIGKIYIQECIKGPFTKSECEKDYISFNIKPFNK